MSTEGRTKFLEWHQEKVDTGYIFDYKTEILAYCQSDVDILLQCCMKFRSVVDIVPLNLCLK